jgi:hypothetical protein
MGGATMPSSRKESVAKADQSRGLNMKTYLTIINPTIAVLVLLLCLWAAMNGDHGFRPREMLQGGIPTYFVAKGLFCSSALFLMGKILALMGERSGK